MYLQVPMSGALALMGPSGALSTALSSTAVRTEPLTALGQHPTVVLFCRRKRKGGGEGEEIHPVKHFPWLLRDI